MGATRRKVRGEGDEAAVGGALGRSGAPGDIEETAWWAGVRDALACSGAMIVGLDTRGVIRAVGPMVARRLGDTGVEGLLGEPVSRFIVPAERARGAEALQTALGGQDWRGPIRLVSARGVERLLKLRVTPLRAGQGELRGVLAELDPAASGDGISRERLDAQSRMAAGLAHSFNNLLTVMRGGTYMLARELPPESPLQQYVREVDEAAEKAAMWARQLGAIGRTIIYRPVPLDPNDLLREAMEFLVTLVSPGTRTRMVSLPDAPEVSVDPARLGQALRALVRNAVDAVGEGGEITLGLKLEDVCSEHGGPSATLAPGRYVVFSVRDDGHGMGPDVLAHALEPHFTTHAPSRGLGLGLPTAAAIARTSGGALELRSAAGVGTEVRLLVPLAPPESAADGPRNEPRRPDLRAGESRAVVLVLEDEPAVLRTVKMSLQRAGMRPVVAGRVEQARRLLATPGLHFDAAVFDVLLPDGRGDEVALEARERYPELPVVLTSGFVATKPLGFQADPRSTFLRKPFSPGELTRALRALIGGA